MTFQLKEADDIELEQIDGILIKPKEMTCYNKQVTFKLKQEDDILVKTRGWHFTKNKRKTLKLK